jgi:hypothetical protein
MSTPIDVGISASASANSGGPFQDSTYYDFGTGSFGVSADQTSSPDTSATASTALPGSTAAQNAALATAGTGGALPGASLSTGTKLILILAGLALSAGGALYLVHKKG